MQRLSLATDQQKLATEQAKGFEAQLMVLREKMAKDILLDRDLQMLIAKLDISLGRLLSAINAVSGALMPRTDVAYASASSKVARADQKMASAARN
jgi:hypothetical protein